MTLKIKRALKLKKNGCYKMRSFKLNEEYSIVCDWKNTRRGFNHYATLLKNGIEQESSKCCYLNRTWESYEYESVMLDLIDIADLTEEEKTTFRDMIKRGF